MFSSSISADGAGCRAPAPAHGVQPRRPRRPRNHRGRPRAFPRRHCGPAARLPAVPPCAGKPAGMARRYANVLCCGGRGVSNLRMRGQAPRRGLTRLRFCRTSHLTTPRSWSSFSRRRCSPPLSTTRCGPACREPAPLGRSAHLWCQIAAALEGGPPTVFDQHVARALEGAATPMASPAKPFSSAATPYGPQRQSRRCWLTLTCPFVCFVLQGAHHG